jgi:nicotinamidase/pyrazinamidase
MSESRSQKLLVVIDPQRDFTDEQGVYARRHSGITQIKRAVENIQVMLQTFRPSVIVCSNYRPDQFEAGLSLCVPGTIGHRPGIKYDESIPVFSKTDHSCFSSPEFVKYLAGQSVAELVLCGFLVEYCVRATALDALDRGFRVSFQANGVGSGDDVQHRVQTTVGELVSKGVILLDQTR